MNKHVDLIINLCYYMFRMERFNSCFLNKGLYIPPAFLKANYGGENLNVFAGVLELADETDSKSVVREGVWVRVPPPAPNP